MINVQSMVIVVSFWTAITTYTYLLTQEVKMFACKKKKGEFSFCHKLSMIREKTLYGLNYRNTITFDKALLQLINYCKIFLSAVQYT